MPDFATELQGSARVDHLINNLAPYLKNLPNGRLVAELSIHAADEALKSAVLTCKRMGQMLSQEEYSILLLTALKCAEHTFRANFISLAEQL